MKKYKLLTKVGYPQDVYIIGKCYYENFKVQEGMNTVEILVRNFPNDWEEVNDNSSEINNEIVNLISYITDHNKGIRLKSIKEFKEIRRIIDVLGLVYNPANEELYDVKEFLKQTLPNSVIISYSSNTNTINLYGSFSESMEIIDYSELKENIIKIYKK